MVTWRDAHFHHTTDDVTEDCLVRTAGWLIAESPELQIASERAPDEDRAITCIPVGIVEHIDFLEVAPDVRDEIGAHATQAGWDDPHAVPA